MTDDKALEKRVAKAESEVAQLQELLRRVGLPMKAEISDDPTERPDYMEPGSDEHLAFLGLTRVEPDSPDEVQFETREGEAGVKYRLIDPVGPFAGSADPKQAAYLALLEKIASFESGPSVVHDRAKKMWVPEDKKPELARLMRRR